MAKHKHYDCIIAWAEGKIIESLRVDDGKWVVVSNPTWRYDLEYRVKPETREYRVGITHDSNPIVARDKKHAEALENCDLVSRWITDWIEYKV